MERFASKMSKSQPEHADSQLPLKRALYAIKDLHAKLETLEHDRREPIAVVGVGCRFPGGANTPDEFWELLRDGRDAIIEVPPDRWDVDAFYASDPDLPGKTVTRSGGFIDQVDLFDPGFFGISPREAISLDPQHRLLLEVSWEALENAHQRWEELAGSRTSIFVGVGANDYARLLQGDRDLTRLDVYSSTGNALSTAAGRIAYILGFQGPCMVIDTACSSSLVAVHLACQSLLLRECDRALAGGVNLMLIPDVGVALSKLGMLSPDGRCKAFDAQADGFGRGEGCGVVVLKRLSDALADGDPIQAVIRGSAVNQDGRSNGLTAPNGRAQEAVIREALAAAELEPEQIDYIEAHGTGTPLGDPIEVLALHAALCKERTEQKPLLVGSVKSNLGHLEASAGIAGLIKVILAFQHEAIPPHLHLQERNPYISWHEMPIAIPTVLTPWPMHAEQRRHAGVSSFGASGTNAHVILEEAPRVSPVRVERASAVPAYLLPLSAHSSQALQAVTGSYRTWLREHPDVPLSNICYTASTRRQQHEYRLALVGKTHKEFDSILSNFLQEKTDPRWSSGRFDPGIPRHKCVFVFSGQGGQYAGMGQVLLEEEPLFREQMEKCDRMLRQYVSWSLLEELRAEEKASRLQQTQIAQPLLFALQISLVGLWRSWGVEPDAVVGHSVGEIAAAYVAQALSLEEALHLVALRGQIMQEAEGQGDMAVIEMPAIELEAILRKYAGRLAIAGYNSPTTTVLSGEYQALLAVIQDLREHEIFCRILNVGYAFHSPQFECFRYPFEASLNAQSSIHPTATVLPFYSTVLGQRVPGQRLDANYWGGNICEPVRFSMAIEHLVADGFDCFVEISPHPVMRHALLQSIYQRSSAEKGFALPLSENEALVIGSLKRQENDRVALLHSLSALYARGIAVKWNAFYPEMLPSVTLPTYPFQRTRFWVKEAPISHAYAADIKSEEMPIETPNAAERLLYEVQWVPLLNEPGDASELSGKMNLPGKASPTKWVIFADRCGIAAALEQELVSRGVSCIFVQAGTTYIRKNEHCYEARPDYPEDIQRFFDDAFEAGKLRCQGVVYLWSLDLALEGSNEALQLPTDDSRATQAVHLLQNARDLGCGSAIALIQVLARRSWDVEVPPRIWFVTRGACAVDACSAPIDFAGLLQTPLWGMGRVLAEEHSELWGGLVDLDNAASDTVSALALCHCLMATGLAERQIAFRQGRYYGARLIRSALSLERSQPLHWHVDGAYMLTGGLGALGREVAHWMVEQGARRLIVLVRTALPPRAEWKDLSSKSPQSAQVATIKALEAQGASVEVASVDVADPKQLQNFLQTYAAEERPPIRGVVHLAGVLEDRLLTQLDPGALDVVWRPKVVGSWLLHTLLRDAPLDFFVGFSAMSALLGSPGLGNYGAANTFLDGLAQYRCAQGLPGLSINWGPWQDRGFAVSPGAQRMSQQLQKRGVKPLSRGQALAALEMALQSKVPQVAVVDIDWRDFVNEDTAEPGVVFLSRVVEEAGVQEEEKQRRPSALPTLRQELATIQPEQRHARVEKLVRELVGQVLRLEEDQIDIQQPLGTLGLDSIMGLEMKRRLERYTGLILSSTIVWNYPTVAALTSHLTSKLHVAFDAEATAATATRSSLPPTEIAASRVTEVEQLTEGEVEALLARTLSALEENM